MIADKNNDDMALIKCTECGAAISDKAEVCPKCGCPVGTDSAAVSEKHEDSPEPDAPKKKSRKWLWVLLAVLVVAGAASAAWFVLSPQGAASAFTGKKEEPKVKITPEFCNAIRKYDELRDFREGFAAVRNGKKWGFINTEGKEVVACKYDEVRWFHDGLAAVLQKGKWGFVDTEGKEVIPFKFDEEQGSAPEFSQGLAFVYVDAKGKRECCFIDKTGEVKLKLADKYIVHYGSEPTFNEDKVCGVETANNKYVFIDMEGNEVKDYKEKPQKEPPYDTFRGKNGKMGVMDRKTGKYIIPAKYSELSSFHNGVALAKLSYTTISSGVSGYDENTVYIYGYVDIEGNETFTSDDYIKVREENNRATMEKSRLDYEAQQNPAWMQGEWYYRNSRGTCYAKIEGDNILVAFGNSVTYNGPYTIEGNRIIYDRHDGMCSYLLIDENRELLLMDENNPMHRSADEANAASGSSGGRSNSSGSYSSRDTHPFETDGDVYDFIGGSFYGPNGRRISLKHNGMYVDGVNTCTTSTIVTSFSGMYARVKVMVIPNDVFTFTVNKANGTLVDMEGGVWHKR